jgi:putative membrane protein
MTRRWTSRPSWADEGEDPDYRFSLANERTFLAWTRTVLALLAGAVAVGALLPSLRDEWMGTALGVALAVAGLVLSLRIYRQWAANERAMRQRAPLPFPAHLRVFAAALAGCALVVMVVVVLDAL